MKTMTTLSAALLMAALAGTTFAQGSMGAGEIGWQDAAPAVGLKTRAQVQAELAQARRDGQLVAAGDAAQTEDQLRTEREGTHFAGLGKTRAQVKAELAAARINGDVVVGESSLTLREEFPQRYPQQRVTTASNLAQRDAR